MKFWAYNWNNVLNDVIEELLKNHEMSMEDADVVLVWNEIKNAGWLDVVLKNQALGKKVLLYQQGIWGIDRVQPPFNEKIHSDAVLVWGEGDKERLEKAGVKKPIYITGSPILAKLKPKKPHKGKNIVFCLEHWDSNDVPENLAVAKELRKLRGANILTKALKGEHNLGLYDNVIVTDRFDRNHLEIITDILSYTDLVVAISESTFALMAEAMDIPVIIADIWEPKERAGEKEYINFRHPFTKAVTLSSLEDLVMNVKYQLKHPEVKREERREMAIKNGGVNISNPVEKMCDIIKNYK